MTTIAWDGRTLAADTQQTQDGYVCGYIRKIFKLDDGRIMAAAGQSPYSHAVVAWLNGGEKPTIKDGDRIEVIVIAKGGAAIEYDEKLLPYPASAPWASGSGGRFALSAMRLGYGAVDAVFHACDLDVCSGGKVEHFDFVSGEIRQYKSSIADGR